MKKLCIAFLLLLLTACSSTSSFNTPNTSVGEPYYYQTDTTPVYYPDYAGFYGEDIHAHGGGHGGGHGR